MTGWKPIPLLLKVLFVVLVLWIAMTISVVAMMPERQIAFFGGLFSGAPATLIVVLLDVISPVAFLYAMWRRLGWGANFGLLYNGIFVLNNVVAFFMYFDLFGSGLYFPLIAGLAFFAAIYKERKYFA